MNWPEFKKKWGRYTGKESSALFRIDRLRQRDEKYLPQPLGISRG
jgi:hypothetical protein